MFIEYLLGASCCVRHLTFMILLSNHIIWGKFLSQLCRWENRGSERLLKVTGLLTEEGSGFEFRVGSLMLPVLVACWALWLLGSCGQHREKCPMFLWHNFIIRIFRTPHGLFKSCCSFAVKAAHCGQVVVDVGADVALSLMGFCWEAHLPHVLGLSSLWAFGEYLNSSLPLNQWQLFQKSFSSGHKVNSQFWAGCPLNCDCPMFSVPLEGWKTTCSVSIHTAITKIPWVGWWGSGGLFLAVLEFVKPEAKALAGLVSGESLSVHRWPSSPCPHVEIRELALLGLPQGHRSGALVTSSNPNCLPRPCLLMPSHGERGSNVRILGDTGRTSITCESGV